MATVLATEVPTIDLNCSTCDLSTAVHDALHNFGFFYVRNHGIRPSIIETQFEASKKLFELPSDVKASLTFNATLDIGCISQPDPSCVSSPSFACCLLD